MKRIIKIDWVIFQVFNMIRKLDAEQLCELYNTLSSKDYVEYYADGVCTVNDKMENAS